MEGGGSVDGIKEGYGIGAGHGCGDGGDCEWEREVWELRWVVCGGRGGWKGEG